MLGLASVPLCLLPVGCSERAQAEPSFGGTTGDAGAGGVAAGGTGAGSADAGADSDAGRSPFDGRKETPVSAMEGSRLYTLTTVDREDSFLSVLTLGENGALELNSTLLTPRNPVSILPQGDRVLLFFNADEPIREGIPRPDFRKETLIWLVDVGDAGSPHFYSELSVEGLYADSFAGNGGYYVVSREVGDSALLGTTNVTSFERTESQLIYRDFFSINDDIGHWIIPVVAHDEDHVIVSDWTEKRWDGFRQLDLASDGKLQGRGVRHLRGDLRLESQLHVAGGRLLAATLPDSGGASLEVFNLTDSGPERLSEFALPGESAGRIGVARVDDTQAFIGGEAALFAATISGTWVSQPLQAAPRQIETLGDEWLVAGRSYSPNQVSLSRVRFQDGALTVSQDLWVPPEPSSSHAGATVLESEGLVLLPFTTNDGSRPSYALNVYDTANGSLTTRGQLPLEGFVWRLLQHSNVSVLIGNGYVTSVTIDDPDAPKVIARRALY